MEFDQNKSYCRYFAELAAIPHGSRNEAAASRWVQDFARKHQLYCQTDAWGNVIIRKPGSRGHEQEPWVMLQAHLDMVMAADPGVQHDWLKDPLDLYVDGDFLKARGTTLGADDGVGVAYMMAILADETLVHPPLECVFTVMEEIGLEGALHIKAEDILSRRVISLDGGSEASTMCCAAGGIKGEIFRNMDMEPVTLQQGWKLNISGLLGGHSGIMIDRNRANAILLSVRFLYMLKEASLSYQLCRLDGGSQDNVIPAFCTAEFACDAAEEELRNITDRLRQQLHLEYRDSDPDLDIRLEPEEHLQKAFTADSTQALLQFLELAPNGVSATALAMDGIPMTSNNLGRVSAEDSRAAVLFRARSLLESGLDDVLRHLRAVADPSGFQIRIIIRYPGWNYQKDSVMREVLDKLVRERFGKPLVAEGTHGGNETGIWSGLHPDSDIVSIGSVEESIHTPQERLDLHRFDSMYFLLTAYLERLADQTEKR